MLHAERILRLADHIEAHAEKFYMYGYWQPVAGKNYPETVAECEEQYNICGTKACMAGHVPLLWPEESKPFQHGAYGIDYQGAGAEILGLSEDEAESLLLNEWPIAYDQAYEQTLLGHQNRKAAALVAATLLREIAAKGFEVVFEEEDSSTQIGVLNEKLDCAGYTRVHLEEC